VDINVTPSLSVSDLANVQLTATKPGGGTTFDNPAGQGLTFSPRGSDIRQWKIDNVRWYSTQADHCNNLSDYEIRATLTAGGIVCATDPVTFTADFTVPSQCGNGATAVNSPWWSGDLDYNAQQVYGMWQVTVTQGTFRRDVHATATWTIAANSQYFNMLSAEELFHENNQFENSNHPVVRNYWLESEVMTDVQIRQPFVGSTEAEARSYARAAFDAALAREDGRSRTAFLYPSPARCAIESEAKNAVGASHRLTMTCTYSACQ
jgi:hypothetical protein